MDTALDLFLELARLPTPPGKERAAVDMVRDVLASFGVECVEDDAGPKINGDAGNLYARIPATAPGTPLFFNAHVDTVPMTAPILSGSIFNLYIRGAYLLTSGRLALMVLLSAPLFCNTVD